MSPDMHDLPVELLGKIVSFVTPVNLAGERDGKADLCHLRLVCRYFNDLVSPVLFGHLSLRFADATCTPNKDCSRCWDIIVALATGTTQAFRHTKSLDFSAFPLYSSACSESLDGSIRKDIVEHIFAAISSLQNLRRVSWQFNSVQEPDTIGIDFIRALGTIPTFEAFDRLCFPEGLGPSITLQPISHLTAIKVVWNDRTEHFINEISSLLGRCSKLANLTLEAPYFNGDGTCFSELFADIDRVGFSLPLRRLEVNGVNLSSRDIISRLQHFRDIEFLGISRNPSAHVDKVFGEICATLKEKDIFLKGICTDFLNDPLLLDYMVSYSGLKELLLDWRLLSPEPPSDLIERFYNEVLPPHHRALEHLRFTMWPLGPAQPGSPPLDPLEEVAKCRSLRMLEVRYPGYGLRKNPGKFEEWLEVGARLQDLVELNIYSYYEPTLCDTLERFREKKGKQFMVWGM